MVGQWLKDGQQRYLWAAFNNYNFISLQCQQGAAGVGYNKNFQKKLFLKRNLNFFFFFKKKKKPFKAFGREKEIKKWLLGVKNFHKQNQKVRPKSCASTTIYPKKL